MLEVDAFFQTVVLVDRRLLERALPFGPYACKRSVVAHPEVDFKCDSPVCECELLPSTQD